MLRDLPLAAAGGLTAGDGNRKTEVECRAPVQVRLAPDPAVMAIDDLLAGGETESGAFEFTPPMQPFERLEDLLVEFRVDADAVVANANAPEAISFGTCRDVHHWRIDIAIFDAVSDQVL